MPRLCRQALSLLRGPAVSTNRLRYHVGNQGVSRQPSFCRCGGVAWSLFRATHDVPTVWALVYRGCPCWDPPVCPPMPRQDGIGSKAPTLCVRSVRPPVVLSSFAGVFVVLVFCGMLEILTPCSTISAALRAHCRFQRSHSGLQLSLDHKLSLDCSSAHVLCLCGGLG